MCVCSCIAAHKLYGFNLCATYQEHTRPADKVAQSALCKCGRGHAGVGAAAVLSCEQYRRLTTHTLKGNGGKRLQLQPISLLTVASHNHWHT